MTPEQAYEAGYSLNEPIIAILAADGADVAKAHDLFTFDANTAEYLIRAANVFPKLVAALKEYVVSSNFDDPYLRARQDRTRAAIEAAEPMD